MKLYLVQHGEAVSKAIDANRPLSKRGERDVELIAAFLERAGIRVSRILHSGKTRAQQTAVALAKSVLLDGDIDAVEGIAPNDPMIAFFDAIASWTEDTFLVGHLPFMSRLVSQLILGQPELEVVAYQPGSIVCLERDDTGTWRLDWMLRPTLFNDM